MNKGVIYFPVGVNFFEQDEIKFVSAKYGEVGELIVIKLLVEIYKHNGYFIKWSSDKALLFADSVGKNVTPKLASDVVSELTRRGFFHKGVYNKHKVLTSAEIQQQYISIVTGRKEVALNTDYLIVKFPKNTSRTTFIDLCKKSCSPDILKSQERNQQRKGKETKEKETKLKDTKEEETSKHNSLEKEELLKELTEKHGKNTVDTYLQKTKKYNLSGLNALQKIEKWIAQDFNKLNNNHGTSVKNKNTSYNLAQYDNMVKNYVPIYKSEKKR